MFLLMCFRRNFRKKKNRKRDEGASPNEGDTHCTNQSLLLCVYRVFVKSASNLGLSHIGGFSSARREN